MPKIEFATEDQVLFTLLLLISWWWCSLHPELVALICAHKGQYFLNVSVVKLHVKLPIDKLCRRSTGNPFVLKTNKTIALPCYIKTLLETITQSTQVCLKRLKTRNTLDTYMGKNSLEILFYLQFLPQIFVTQIHFKSKKF